MRRKKEIKNFVRDVKDASKIIGGHIPIVKQGLEARDIYWVSKRLGMSTPRAIQAAKTTFKSQLRDRRERLKNQLRKRLSLRSYKYGR